MAARQQSKLRPPLDSAKLDELAISYVGRFATSRARLVRYLAHKLRERGWSGASEPDLDGLADRLIRLGYIDDRAFALAKARTMVGKGFGSRRVRQALVHAGIDDESSCDARQLAEAEGFNAALKFARRKAIGPFAHGRPDARGRQRALAAMIRAGHGIAIARAVVDLEPGEVPEGEDWFQP